MEMHIVSMKDGLSPDSAAKQEDGYAVLGFFLNAKNDQDTSEAWTTLTSFLPNIKEVDQMVNVDQNISINGLIGDVDLSKYYRYMGSLTTPQCSEAVVWTLFHEPIPVNSTLIQMFPLMTSFVDIYRPTQDLNGRQVYTSASSVPSHSWCYEGHLCDYAPSNWSFLPEAKCGGEQQSPINIDTQSTTEDESLGAFTFLNFDDKHAIESITNTGHSVQCNINGSVEVSGGGLPHVYTVLQFHFHWGSVASDGSEHLLDSKRFPMEMHIVCIRKDLNRSEALAQSDGLAVLGFFIEAPQTSKSGSHSSSTSDSSGTTNPPTSSTSDMEAWTKLTNYLDQIQTVNSQVPFSDEISIDDVLGNVDRHSYFRYNGSLTTPQCNEAVVWTVFKESIKVNQNLMTKFPESTGYENIYRPQQEQYSRTILSTKVSAGSSLQVKSARLFYPLLVFVWALLY
uniref:Carbonic anhydrase n=1 Tax=Oryzias latipes TaxID=8090 RepID=A0A3P9KYQ1_ORYLA